MLPTRSLGLVSLLVRDYDEALAFYVGTLGFHLLEDRPMPAQDKRWVVVSPQALAADGTAPAGTGLLLARASNAEQAARVGSQAGGRVFFFLDTDDVHRDYALWRQRGVVFTQEPTVRPHGTVAIFQDLYGNAWDLIGPGHP